MNIVTRIQEQVATLDETSRQRTVVIAAGVLFICLAFALLQSHLAQLERRKQVREQTLTELLALQQRYQEATVEANRLKNRLAMVTPDDSPVTILEQTGIVPKNGIQAKPLPRQEKQNLLEESAEISLAGISLNELVNLLFRLEQHAKPVAIKKLVARTRFSDPMKLDVNLILAVYRPAAPQQQ